MGKEEGGGERTGKSRMIIRLGLCLDAESYRSLKHLGQGRISHGGREDVIVMVEEKRVKKGSGMCRVLTTWTVR
jgi:hypothetical protein